MPPEAASHLQHLELTCMDVTITDETIAQLATLTSLQVLHLPRLQIDRVEDAATERKMAPAMSALTNLTELFIRAPPVSIQRVLQTSLQELTIAPYCGDRGLIWDVDQVVLLQLGHLTKLRKLKLFFYPHRPSQSCYGLACTELKQLLGGAHDVARSSVDVMLEAMPHMVSTEVIPDCHENFRPLTLASFSFHQPSAAGPALTTLSAV